MLIIGVCGRARNGKNMVARAIQDVAWAWEFSTEIYEFGALVLAELKLSGLIPQKTQREELTPDQLKTLVEHGNYRRKKHPFYWIDRLMAEIDKDKPDVAILPNIRFLNEAEYVKAVGQPGKIIRVTSLVADGVPFISPDRNPNDPTETEQSRIEADYFITVRRGDAHLAELQAKAIFAYINHK